MLSIFFFFYLKHKNSPFYPFENNTYDCGELLRMKTIEKLFDVYVSTAAATHIIKNFRSLRRRGGSAHFLTAAAAEEF